ncbi:MAG: GTP-binding protein, partial [Bdellovibrionota bacterium]
IMGMVDGAILLVDAAEGPLPQTRFVLQKSLRTGHRVILIINKVDRPECKDGLRIHEVVNQTFDLFVELGANEKQLEFPILYACGKDGWCTTEFEDVAKVLAGTMEKPTLKPLYDAILNEVPAPRIGEAPGFQMLVSNLSYSEYVGRLAIGRVMSGGLKRSQKILRRGIDPNSGNPKNETFGAAKLYTFEGLKQAEVENIVAGDIGVVAGNEQVEIGDTLCGDDQVPAMPRIYVEPPTIGMVFSVNTSPLSGREGEAIQSRKLRERLLREARNNVAIRFEETPLPDQFRILGRGELQFAILIEQMRREGFEIMVGKPTVLSQNDPATGQKLEPVERAVLDLPEEHSGEVTRLFQERKGILTKFEAQQHGRARLEFEIPTRGLLGIRSRYLTLTRGSGLFSTEFLGYQPHKGLIVHRINGALVSDRAGETMEYALLNLEDRGVLFFKQGVEVYEGMVVGENNKDTDLNVNVCREKKLTNVRAAHAELLVTLSGIRQMPLERCIEWIDDDEWIEITPKNVRVRKKILAQNLRPIKRNQAEG